ncbi:hypothetical protein EU508_18475 [Pseudoalteromonas fuliginea]|uniref:Lipoprotein n=1 Tax=Pseudoalteromonas fuliginea TaxID=1872678 RepID=A0AB73BCJ9_9GAMM|nr:hypothetical protein [Pseudoalteromonas fuliginea]KAA1156910.1 hypothetical protein EU508_18475 [Pseudoalteromonas fuliginea]
MYLKFSLIITTIIFLISCGEVSKKEALDETYGTLRIPVLTECPIDLKELEIPQIKSLELVSFDLKISGSNVNSYLHIEHKGLPSVVLTKVQGTLGNCIPNILVKYDNSELLAQDLDNYKSASLSKPIYIKADNGQFEVRYQKR